jgi:hypothetical protein
VPILLHDIPDIIRRNLPYTVDLPTDADSQSHRRKINAAIEWCTRENGRMAFTDPLRKANAQKWDYNEDCRWDMLGDRFHFRNERDAAVFRVFWG